MGKLREPELRSEGMGAKVGAAGVLVYICTMYSTLIPCVLYSVI